MARVLILGLGKSGVAAAKHALAQGDEVCIYGGKKGEATLAAAQPFVESGVEVVFDSEDVQGHYDLCVVCPGIPQTCAFYQNALAASDELISEPEYAWRLDPANWVAVTGTNGKTTTTSLITHLLESCGVPAYSCGNIGETTTEAVDHRREGEVLVAEMSSYQLASTKDFSPRTAVLLNITPDHLAWHGSLDAYAEAKLKIFSQLKQGQTAVVSEDVCGIDAVVDELRACGVRVLTVGSAGQADCAWADGDSVLHYVDSQGCDHEVATADELKIKGSHNVFNALVAACVAIDLGCDLDQVREGLKTFAPLEHRIEPVDEVGGVAFFNDSKGTNTDATIKALTAFPGRGIVLLLGGRDKGTDLTELYEAVEASCKAVICYGEAGKRFFDVFDKSRISCELAGKMADAFERACVLAQPGEVVLLSPACASFDEFNSFEHRGTVFKQLVADYKARSL